ncbi:MAG: 2-phosphosulfolactate phosphatase [Clostridia bacterium]|nr:2-phosphosulfolactate phosphatase [Clostridia bacterium]
MNVKILHLVEGARAARGLTVIIDVFRAFSVEAYLLSRGVERIIPIGDADTAYRLKRENPDYILAGERHGRILPGFDMGNSPSQFLSLDVKNKTVVHTTSAGTQGIAGAKNAEEILGASLVNARATADYIRKSGADEVSLVCMGLDALAPTEEDTLCALYIKSILENTDTDIDILSEVDKLRYTSGAKFFDPYQSDVFPKEDFAMCTDVDRFDFVLKLVKRDDTLPYIVKETVL